MLKFPHISLFRNVLAYVKHVNTDPEVPEQYRIKAPVTFGGSIKLHGSNCGVVYDVADGTLTPQSRDKVLTLPSGDYKGFARFCEDNTATIQALFNFISEILIAEPTKLALYGEWVGQGVLKRNKDSAVSKFTPENRHWALFSVAACFGDDEAKDITPLVLYDAVHVVLPEERGRIGFVHDAGSWNVTIDFSDPESIKAGEAECQRITDAVTAQCPYGKIYGLEGAGEGVVWRPLGGHFNREDLYWKLKSEAHQVVNEDKLKQVPKVVDADVQFRMDAFVDATVTDNRLNQGIEVLEAVCPGLDKRRTGKFIRWVCEDVERECVVELADAGLTWGQVSGAVTTRARNFFFAELEK